MTPEQLREIAGKLFADDLAWSQYDSANWTRARMAMYMVEQVAAEVARRTRQECRDIAEAEPHKELREVGRGEVRHISGKEMKSGSPPRSRRGSERQQTMRL